MNLGDVFMKIIYEGTSRWNYYLSNPFEKDGEPLAVSEEDFFQCVGFDRNLVQMKYQEKNINRQNFYLDDMLLGYRCRKT